MRALVIAHDMLSQPGMIGERLVERGYELALVVPSDGDRFPWPDGFDVVLAMGAPWCMRDPDVGAWIDDELALLRAAVARQIPVLGVCFGAQALAAALGGTVRPAARKEMGWMRVDTLDPRRIPAGPWLQWHGDVFTLPVGASLLAHTEVGPQAYAVGPHLGVQFHPEATAELIRPWVELSRAELAGHGIDPDALLAQTAREEERTRPLVTRLVDDFLANAWSAP